MVREALGSLGLLTAPLWSLLPKALMRLQETGAGETGLLRWEERRAKEVLSFGPLPLEVWSPEVHHPHHFFLFPSFWSLVEMQTLGPYPDLLNQNLHLNKVS